MTRYALQRLMTSVIVLLGAMTIIFVVVRLLPGDPVANILGAGATEEEIEAARRGLGLDRPLLVQYLEFMRDALLLDFDDSIRLSGSAMSNVLERLPRTVELAVAATAIAVLLSFPLGIAAGRRPNGVLDNAIMMGSLVGQSVPTFWVGLIFILVLSQELRLLPSGGTGGPEHIILPAVTLAIPMLAILVRLIRSGLIEALNESYIDTARSKGLPEWKVIYFHAVPNLMIPVVTIVGLELGGVLGGAVVIEVVFAWPGVGRLLVNAITHRDFTIVQAAITLITAIFVIVNLVVDLLYAYIDPRVRLGASMTS
ncbi:MAG: ABC transporter permease [Dongiaceae bacterium]